MTATSESAKKSFRRSCGISVLFCLLILGGLSGLTCSSAYAAVYVDKDAVSGANNGSSWADAFTNLKMALEETGAGEIWVAEGTYYPTTAPDHTAETDRTLFFPLNDGIFLYGGFNGTESLLSERDPVANVTILSGDIGAAGDNTDNNLHVVYAGGAPASVALLDGFTVTGGNASGTVFPDNSGAGIYNEVSLSVKNCIVIGNRAVSGGGMYNYFGNPLLDNCTFSNNTAVNFDGGGICHYGGNLTLSRSLISSNTAEQNGGGIYIYSAADSLIHLSNCTISGNGAAGDTMQVFGGGAIYYGGTVSGTGAMSLLNCTVYNNSSSDGHCGGILNNSVFTVNMHNTILAGNTDTMGFADYYGTLNSLGYNIIQGGGGTLTGDTGTNITGTDPVLSPLADNGGSTQTHALPAGSIAIDAGDPAFASPPDFDQRGDGFPRLNNCRVDIGAYESDLIPEIQVSDEGGTDIVSGSGIADFGSTPLGTSVPKIFTVNNTGTNDLVLSNPTVPTGFIISSFVPPLFVSPSGSASFTVLLDAATAGTFSGALQFDTTDYCDENPFTFTVQGTVALPEIDIFQGTIPIAGGGTYDFGAVAVNANSGPVVFTISNTGGADLILTGTPLMVNLSGADASEFAVDESATSLTLAPAGTTTFAVTFSPMTAEGKTAQISVGNNDSDENPYIISLSGSGQNTAPAASDDGPYTVTEDSVSPLTLEPPGVLGNDSDANGDSIAAVLLTDPAHALSFDLFSDGSFTYTPALNFSGTDFFTYKVNDGFLDSAEATVTISVTAVNDPPVITSAAPTSGTEDLPYSYQVTVDDPDDAGNGTDISFSLSGEPAGMTVSPTGLITWTPGEGVITSGSVTVTAADGGEDGAQPATQSFSVTVTPVNDPPEFTSSAVLSATENSPYTYDISAADADSTLLYITAPQKPAWLTLEDRGDGTALLSGTPTAADAGEHIVILLVKDADDAQDTQEFIITVSPENTPPEILNLDGDTLIYSEGPMPLDEGQDALVSDADGPGLDYGYLHVEITEGGSAEDILKIAEDADGDGDSTTGISANAEGDVSYDNNYIGYIGSDFGNTVLKIFFYSEYADTTAVSQLIRAVRYENTAAELPSEAKTVLVKIYDGYAYSFPASVTVSFASLYTVTVSVSGGGSVSGPGISCSPECTASFPYGTKVFLQAQPYSGYIFSGWTGDLQSAAAGISVTVDGDKYITAAFTMVHNPYPYPGPSTDLCPSDPLKTAPGICGCGVADTDRDGDGIYDCKDGCPDDPGKSEEGVCGCGTADTDRDGDGIYDCKDGCPDDPGKSEEGVCGCGTADTDRDGDGIYDCKDGCPDDPGKSEEGVCGCGTADTDRDGDGIYDCKDGCPDDPGKSEEGVCGCGTADTDRDGDGIPDCKDGCPDDPFKTAPGVCGCGTEDTDRDGDGIPDCEGNEPPSPPQPADGEDTKIYPDGTVTLQTAPFSDAEGDSHLETVWMIYKSADPCGQSLIQHTSSADLTEFTVSGLLPGMIYRWKAGFRDSGSGKISWSEEQTLIVGEKIWEESIWVEPGTEISDYRMITFPFWSENPAASRVLSEEIGGNYDIKYFRIGEFDTESGEYTEYGPDLAFLPGRSYWFLARNGLEIPQIGVPVTLEEDADIRLAYNPLTGEGWNMAGVPGNADFFWHDVEVVIGGSGCETLAVGELPEDNPYINIYLWQWRGDGYSPDTEIMESGKGYWVRARQGNIWLRFPADKWYPPGQAGTLSARRGGNIVKSPSSRRARTGNGESPPMPPGVLDTSENEASGSGGETSGDGGGGCFIRVIR